MTYWTATTTFHTMFQLNDMKSYHGYHRHNIETNQCFSDGGGYLNNYKDLYTKYPNSMFILNTRSLHSWVMSRFKHGLYTKQSWAYPTNEEMLNEWVNLRETFFKEALCFFQKGSL